MIPSLQGVPEARKRDALRRTWWLERAFLHEVRRSKPLGAAVAAFFALAWWPASPLLALIYLLQARVRPGGWARRRCFMSPGRDAILIVKAVRDSWVVADHASSRPGTGQGKRLRDLVGPRLIAAASAADVGIQFTAANRKLAEVFAIDLPGLVDVGPGFPRGRRMRRSPTSQA